MNRKATSTDEAAAQDGGADKVTANARNRRMRLRAAWMYYIEDMTQNDIAQRLGLGRVTVVRLLNDALERHEVKFTIESGVPECVNLERALERRFGLAEAVVAPLSSPEADAALAVSAATGQYMSELVRPGMKLGLGWGRTLLESLRYIRTTPVPDLSVVSMLGGITKIKRYNPSEFAWRFSSLFQAECLQMNAPALVDSPASRRMLIEGCGLGEVFDKARELDAVLLSVGDLAPTATAFRDGYLSDEVRRSMLRLGAVGESLFHFYDARGQLIDHPIHECVMAIPPDTIRQVPQRIVASGGVGKARALHATMRLFKPTVLITDEHAAARMLEIDQEG
ncbi:MULTISPECIES: sugar-binding transcriptional regulator [Pseudacidovorax]|nr:MULTISPECIES: sugar-binding transcriptional regulator [Pseudacidovorax]